MFHIQELFLENLRNARKEFKAAQRGETQLEKAMKILDKLYLDKTDDSGMVHLKSKYFNSPVQSLMKP